MGISDPDQSGTASLTVIAVNPDELGRQKVGQALAGASTAFLAVVPPSTSESDPTVASLAMRLTDEPELGLIIARSAEHANDDAHRADNDAGLASVPSGRELVKRLAALSARTAEQSAPTPIIVLRVEAARAVGGFDPALPGLGWVDLIERLRRAGHQVAGIIGALPFVDALHAGLSGAEQIRSEGLWLVTYGEPGGPILPMRYRRAVMLAAGASGRGGRRERAAAVATDARRWWRGPAPHEEQVGVGRRADWRFLLADRDRNHLLVLDGADAPSRWRWLVDDGWVDRVSTSVAELGGNGVDPDVIYIARGVPRTHGLAAAGANCAVIIEHGRSPVERRGAMRAIDVAGGFGEVHRVLVTPDLDAPKRFVPLGVDGGLEWLLGGPPNMQEHGRSLPRSLASRVRAGAVRLADRASGSSAADLAGAALGPGLIIATRGDEPISDVLSPSGGSVLLTSGHDEGSRVVLIPVSAGSTAMPTGVAVTKIAPRPRYNANINAELARLRRLQDLIVTSGDTTISGLLPAVDGPFDRGPLRSSTESYAGRWSASDLCYRTPETQNDVLETVVEAIDHFSLATLKERMTWSGDHFDEQLGSLFDRYGELVGRDESVERLRQLLRHRSDTLNGHVIPLVDRHFDLGPWNVVIGPDSAMTIIDWELGPPRSVDQAGLAGADQLYFMKYWLHIAMGLRSVDEELAGFIFLAEEGDDPRRNAKRILETSLDRLGVPPSFVPLLTAHVWLEASLHTIERRRGSGIEPGSPGRYLATVARHADRLMAFWPPAA